VFGCVRMCLNVFGCVWMCLNVFECVRMCLCDRQTHPNTCKHIQPKYYWYCTYHRHRPWPPPPPPPTGLQPWTMDGPGPWPPPPPIGFLFDMQRWWRRQAAGGGTIRQAASSLIEWNYWTQYPRRRGIGLLIGGVDMILATIDSLLN